MLKIPSKAPAWQSIKDFKAIYKLLENEEVQALIEKTDRLYYSWDKFRRQHLPEGYKLDEVWAFIRLKRQFNSNPTPVNDINHKPFLFWLTDEIQMNLHLIDQSTGGNLALYDPGNDKRASAKFMVSSLMEEAITSSQIEGAVATIR